MNCHAVSTDPWYIRSTIPGHRVISWAMRGRIAEVGGGGAGVGGGGVVMPAYKVTVYIN
jgi:hypothetical protein